MQSEITARAAFTQIRYAQCWEDADVLLAGLAIQPGDVCLSIASAGDNTLSLLTRNPGRVIALDVSTAQLACLELRVAAYRVLDHGALLELLGSRPSQRRLTLYQRCRQQLSADARTFWDGHAHDIAQGIGSLGKFERYFALFRRRVLPLVHARRTVLALLEPRPGAERERFYAARWNTWRWRLLFTLFFSRFTMGRLGRDPSFFTYVEGAVAERILARVHYALTQLAPAENPYLHWILTGTHGEALPHALRPEHFDAIRQNLYRLEWRATSVEAFLDEVGAMAIDHFNLSDIFEYMSEDNYHRLLERLVHAGRAGGRLAYWNMLVPRRRPASMADRLTARRDLAERLFQQDKAFFYRDFVVEEIV